MKHISGHIYLYERRRETKVGGVGYTLGWLRRIT